MNVILASGDMGGLVTLVLLMALIPFFIIVGIKGFLLRRLGAFRDSYGCESWRRVIIVVSGLVWLELTLALVVEAFVGHEIYQWVRREALFGNENHVAQQDFMDGVRIGMMFVTVWIIDAFVAVARKKTRFKALDITIVTTPTVAGYWLFTTFVA